MKMENITVIVQDLINNWNDPKTITGAVVVAVVSIVIRFFEKKKLVEKLTGKK